MIPMSDSDSSSEEISKEQIKCPVRKCTRKALKRANIVNHIEQKHLDVLVFEGDIITPIVIDILDLLTLAKREKYPRLCLLKLYFPPRSETVPVTLHIGKSDLDDEQKNWSQMTLSDNMFATKYYMWLNTVFSYQLKYLLSVQLDEEEPFIIYKGIAGSLKSETCVSEIPDSDCLTINSDDFKKKLTDDTKLILKITLMPFRISKSFSIGRSLRLDDDLN